MGLRGETATALRWSAGLKAGSQALSWAATFLVIRLLTPEDYGLMAMTMAVVALAQRFSDFGFHTAIVRAPTLSRELVQTNLGLSVGLNLGLFTLLFAAAPVVSRYFGEDITWYVRGVATIFLLAPLGMAYSALLARALEFRRLSLINEGAGQIGSVTSLALAVAGFGVWALVGGVVAGAVSRALLLVALAPDRYHPTFSRAAARRHFRFGGLIALQNILRWLSNQIDVLVLGRLLPTAALGGYHVARNLTDMPNTKLGQLFGQLPLAAFARLQDRPEALRQALQEALGMMLRVTVPGFVLLAVVAPEFVGVVLGPRWLGIAPLIAILAWAMPLRLVLTISTQALNAIGRPGIGALANGLLSLAIAAGALLAAPFGLAAIAGAVAVAYVGATLIALGIAGRHTGFGPRALAGSLWRPLLAASVMAGAVAAARLLLPEAATDWQVLATLLVVAAPAYAGPLLLVDRRGVRETVRFLRG